MRETIFTDPADGAFTKATPELLFDLIRTRSEDYWNDPDGGGFAMLTDCPEGWTDDGPQTARLHFTKLNRLGFHFYYCFEVSDLDSPYHREPEYFYSCTSDDFSEVSQVNWAGELRDIHNALFVGTEAAVEIVQQFLASGDSPATRRLRVVLRTPARPPKPE